MSKSYITGLFSLILIAHLVIGIAFSPFIYAEDPNSFLGRARLIVASFIAAPQQSERVATARRSFELRERARAREALVGLGFNDPSGELALIFFFEPSNDESLFMAREIETLYQDLSYLDTGIEVVGYTTEHSTDEIQSFRNMTKATFPISSELAQSRMEELPAFAIVSPGLGRTFVQSGVRSHFYISELVRVIRGGF